MTKTWEQARDESASLEAAYYSNIQFPPQWVEINGRDGLKQDVNAARRTRCHDDHKWGVEKGANFGRAYGIAEERKRSEKLVDAARELIEILTDYESRKSIDSFTAQPLIAALTAYEEGSG
jgi:hypothetical protein